jgi:hypothetical protein
MSDERLAKDAVFIKWGRFQLGVSGRLAIIAVVIVVALLMTGQWLGLR